MAAALQLDGIDDHILATSNVSTPNGFVFSGRVRFNSFPSVNFQTHISIGGAGELVSFGIGSDGRFRFILRNSAFTVSDTCVIGQWYNFEISQPAGSGWRIITAKVDAVTLASANKPAPLLGNGLMRAGVNLDGSRFVEVDIEYLEYEELTTGTDNAYWDAALSDHSNTGLQPVLTDTIGSNNATGVDMFADGGAWIDSGSGSEQSIIVITVEQLTQSQIIDIQALNQVAAITSEQLTQVNLNAVATINNISNVVTEQINQSALVDNTHAQLITAIQTQQLTDSLQIAITSDGAQDVNVVVTEQATQVQALIASEIAHIQAVISEQITQSINSEILENQLINAITAEQVTQAITVTVDEFSGIGITVVQTEQLTQAEAAGIDVENMVNAIVTEQLTQHSTQQIAVDLTLSPLVCEQLTQSQLIAIIESNIAQQLNIDIDQVTLEILTPTYSIEMLTPTYTIEHIH